MTGTIGKKPTTHDVDADWVLKRGKLSPFAQLTLAREK